MNFQLLGKLKSIFNKYQLPFEVPKTNFMAKKPIVKSYKKIFPVQIKLHRVFNKT